MFKKKVSEDDFYVALDDIDFDLNSIYERLSDLETLLNKKDKESKMLKEKVKELEIHIGSLKNELEDSKMAKAEYNEEEEQRKKAIMDNIKAIQDYTLDDAINYIRFGE